MRCSCGNDFEKHPERFDELHQCPLILLCLDCNRMMETGCFGKSCDACEEEESGDFNDE